MDCVEHFSNYRQFLKRRFSEVSVSVRRCNLPADVEGDCRQLGDGTFAIRVSNDLTDPAQIDCLTHEYAHVLSWQTCTNDHGRIWGQQYAVVYQAYCDWCDEVTE